MQQFNFPTVLLYGEGALNAWAEKIKGRMGRPLIVTDSTLAGLGVADKIAKLLAGLGMQAKVFDGTHPNPLEADVDAGVLAYRSGACDGLVALGGGSPIDVAKVIRFRINHGGPLAQYDDAKGGDKLIHPPFPPLYALPTTAGTGSEVGRSGVILLKETGKKTIFFHPGLMPDMAVLEPKLTAGLPAPVTAATGIDALTHCLEAYLAPVFHPMADGIALEGIRLILRHLPRAFAQGDDLQARGCMQLAASMGATAFQKGLGMVHSLAHPLSAHYNTHHGLANALLLPFAVAFLESRELSASQSAKLHRLQSLFLEAGWDGPALSHHLRDFIGGLQIRFGLRHYGIPEGDLPGLSRDAYEDGCHATNLLPVTREDMLTVYASAW